MAQHDYVIANGTGAAVRSDLNNGLAAIVSQNSGPTEPTTTYAYMRWADTATGVMKMRNGANNAWITLYQLDGEWSTIAFENGSAAAPSIYFKDSGTDTGIYSPGADQVAISTNGAGRLFVNSSGSVGIGTSVPGTLLHLAGNNTGTTGDSPVATIRLEDTDGSTSDDQPIGKIEFYGNDSTTPAVGVQSYIISRAVSTSGGGYLEFGTRPNGGASADPRMRIDGSGRLLVGTSTNNATFNSRLQVKSDNTTAGGVVIDHYENDTTGGIVYLAKSRSATVGTMTVVQNGDTLGQVQFWGADGTQHRQGASIAAVVDAAPGAADMPSRLVFSTTADGASSPTERMRLDSQGYILFGKTAASLTTGGIEVRPVSADEGLYITNTRSGGGQAMFINRQVSDGNLIEFRQANTAEGTISVSGTTVTYGGGHLARWSQLPNDEDPSGILKGTVMSNLDEMCDWGEEDNEQLNKTKISDVEGDKNVAGVFVSTSFSDDGPLDFFVGMTGDMIIRIAEGVTVERGDLLMSAGDGTAKPQDDDIIRSRTIAKVTSTNVSCTYEDGSYCVPCVLMAC